MPHKSKGVKKVVKAKNVMITLKGKGYYFKVKVPLWKAYLVMAHIEKENLPT